MKLVNYHFHSKCSHDSTAELTDMAAAAEKAGITELCLTDHCDLLGAQGEINRQPLSFSAVDAELRETRSRFPALVLKKGVELGEGAMVPDLAEKILRQQPDLDFVIGSVHNVRMDTDYYWYRYESEAHCRTLLERYVEDLLILSRTDYYDVIAHITYPLRYMRARDGFQVDFSPLMDQIREVLRTVVERGRGIELNTSGYRTNNGQPLPTEDILRMYRELGGEHITIGTDAHEPKYMDDGLLRGYDLLRTVGFRYLTTFEKRQPIQLPL